MRVQSLGQEDPLEKGMATHSSILAWRLPQAEEPGGLQSVGSQRGRHDRAQTIRGNDPVRLSSLGLFSGFSVVFITRSGEVA